MRIEVFQESLKAKNAENAVRRFLKANELNFIIKKTIPIIGHVVVLENDFEISNWQTAIYDLIILANSFGSSWQISGDIENSFCIESSHLNNNHVGILKVVMGISQKPDNQLMLKSYYDIKGALFIT